MDHRLVKTIRTASGAQPRCFHLTKVQETAATSAMFDLNLTHNLKTVQPSVIIRNRENMRIAILVSVSDYNSPKLISLPACINDHTLMLKIIHESGEFDAVFEVINPSASHLKLKLSDFVDTYKDEVVDEVFFYYSGHGGTFDDDFYFTPSNFDSTNRRSTGLSNDELDQLLRSLNGELTVKFIDACHAGIHYVKDSNVIVDKALKSTQINFKKCYFFFGSDTDGRSYQDDALSFFTQSFAAALAGHAEQSIRYRDIAAYIADDFERSGFQTPFFVSQALGTERFVNLSDSMRTLIDGQLLSQSVPKVSPIEPPATKADLVEWIQNHAKQYCSRDEAMSTLTKIGLEFTKYEVAKPLSELFDFEVNLLETVMPSFRLRQDSYPGDLLVANEEDVFANYVYENEKYEVEIPVKQGLAAFEMITALYGERPTKTVTRTRKLIVGLHFTETPPFTEVRIVAKPKFPNLPWFELHAFHVFSKVDVLLIYSISRRKLLDWKGEKFRRDRIGGWRSVVGPLKQHQVGPGVEVFGTFEAQIRQELENILPEGTKVTTKSSQSA